MSADALLVYAGFFAAAFLFFVAAQNRGLAAIAVVASGLEILRHLDVIRLQIGRVPGYVLPLVLALGLAVPALLVWFKSTAKSAVSASAIGTLVGVIQVLGVFTRVTR